MGLRDSITSTVSSRSRANLWAPTEPTIDHETVAAAYTQRGTSQQMTQGIGAVLNGRAINPVQDEFAFQSAVKMEYIAWQMNYRILNQTYRNPADNTVSRRTRGLRQAVTTNVVDAAGVSITCAMFDELFVEMINSDAVVNDDDIMLLSNTTQIAKINELYSGYNHNSGVPIDRFVSGVRIRTIYTAFGMLHLVLERDLP